VRHPVGVAPVRMLVVPALVSAQRPAVGRVGIGAVLKASYAGSKADRMAEADKMGHVAAGQFGICSAVRDVPNRMAGKSLEAFKTKAEFKKVLADSFEFCDDVFVSTTDEKALQGVRQGAHELPRAAVLFGQLAHNSEMYGIGTVYLRLKGLEPPSTERQNAQAPR
jgi:hypothetical protein